MTSERERRPAEDRAAQGDIESIADCALCERRPRARDREWCHRCLRDTCDGIRRRRAAALRMPRLDDGRRDPLDRPDRRWVA